MTVATPAILETGPLQSGSAGETALSEVARQVRECLGAYPHFVVAKAAGAPDDPATLVALAHAVAEPVRRRETGKPRLSFTHVRIDPENAAAPRKSGTRYSRTNRPMAPHTDASFDANPHRLVAFQCVTADDTGGESILVAIEDILAQADEELVAILREPVYPLGKALRPIITGEAGQEEIRYYRTQIDRAIGEGAALASERHRAAMDRLDAILDRSELSHKVHLLPGQILFMHNRKVLHGRSGFPRESRRHFYRIRLRGQRLG